MQIKKLNKLPKGSWDRYVIAHDLSKTLDLYSAMFGNCSLYQKSYNIQILRLHDKEETYEMRTETIDQMLEDINLCYYNTL